MPFKDAARRRVYMRNYMRDRYAVEKAFGAVAVMREDRKRMSKALKRLERAQRRAEENPGSVDECALSLAWQWNQIELGE